MIDKKTLKAAARRELAMALRFQRIDNGFGTKADLKWLKTVTWKMPKGWTMQPGLARTKRKP